MQILGFAWDIVDSNSWLVIEGNDGFLIDVVDNSDLYERVMQLSTLTVVLTHSHFDHITGLNHLRIIRPDTKVISTKLCSDHIGNEFRNLSSAATAYMSFYEGGAKKDTIIDPFICGPAEQTFDEELIFDWNGHSVCLSSVYGHSNDGLLATIDNKFLFSGDTLLHIPTITRFPTGSTRKFREEDMEKIRSMTKIEKVFPGHGLSGNYLEFVAVNSAYNTEKQINQK